MTVKRKAPGVAPTTAGGDQQNPVPEPTADHPFPQLWNRRKGRASAQFGRKKHFILAHDHDGYWLVQHPGGLATWLSEYPGPARDLARKKVGTAPLLAEDAV